MAEYLIDPETDAPVIRPVGKDHVLHAAVPQRLPARSPLAELILKGPIWIRTEDGTLYMAPRGNYFGLSWGYAGSGPGTLALLIHRLLDDINAPAANSSNGAPATLKVFTQINWPQGTVFTRQQLEAARNGRPYHKPGGES